MDQSGKSSFSWRWAIIPYRITSILQICTTLLFKMFAPSMEFEPFDSIRLRLSSNIHCFSLSYTIFSSFYSIGADSSTPDLWSITMNYILKIAIDYEI